MGSISEKILDVLTSSDDVYVEPFIGGGSVFIYVMQKCDKLKIYPTFMLNDANTNLIKLFQYIKDQPEELIEECK